MTKIQFVFSSVGLGIIFLAGIISASAQHAQTANTPAIDPTTAAISFFQNAAFDPGQIPVQRFRERDLGWVSGRVSENAGGDAQAPNSQGIGGVRIILRSADAGYGSFIREQVTNESGTYDFQALGAGKYSVEIDSASLPANYRISGPSVTTVDVKALDRSYIELDITPQRSITGTVFIDKDGDGRYKQGKDVPVEGAYIVIDGHFTTSDSNGVYSLRGLPAGRIGLLVSWPKTSENTHVVMDLGDGPVTNRVVNVAMGR